MIHGSWGFDCSCPANLRGVLHSLFSPAYWGPLPPYPRLPFLLVVTRLSPLSPALVAQPPSRLSSSHFRLIRHTGSHTLLPITGWDHRDPIRWITSTHCYNILPPRLKILPFCSPRTVVGDGDRHH